MSDPWVHRLSEYIDDELLPQERQDLESHLGRCGHCTTTLDELCAVVDEARSLEDHFPARDLWPEISRRLDDAEVEDTVEPVAPVRSPAPSRFSFSSTQLWAACVAVVFVSAALGWWGARLSTPTPGETPVTNRGPVAQRPDDSGSDVVAAGDLDNLAHGLARYQLSIEQLEEQLRAQASNLDPETLDTIRRNLRSIDDAIFESRKAVTRNPDSEYLNAHLADSIQRKLRLLRQANTLADNHM